jgi:hypothetical protein
MVFIYSTDMGVSMGYDLLFVGMCLTLKTDEVHEWSTKVVEEINYSRLP